MKPEPDGRTAATNSEGTDSEPRSRMESSIVGKKAETRIRNLSGEIGMPPRLTLSATAITWKCRAIKRRGQVTRAFKILLSGQVPIGY